MAFWTAWRFLTIFPALGNRGIDQKGIGASVAFFPLVGFALGVILLGFDQLFDPFMPPLLSSALLIVALIIFTGALHFDGLMDTFDGFAVRRSAAERLAIMSDSRVGGFGVMAAVCVALVKVASLTGLPPDLRPTALLLIPTLGRWSAACAILTFSSAKKAGLGQAYKSMANRNTLIVATALALTIAVVFLGYVGLGLMAGIAAVTYLVARLLASRLGGLTGDTYGAIIELVEVCVLIGLAIIGEAGGTSWLGSYL